MSQTHHYSISIISVYDNEHFNSLISLSSIGPNRSRRLTMISPPLSSRIKAWSVDDIRSRPVRNSEHRSVPGYKNGISQWKRWNIQRLYIYDLIGRLLLLSLKLTAKNTDTRVFHFEMFMYPATWHYIKIRIAVTKIIPMHDECITNDAVTNTARHCPSELFRPIHIATTCLVP